MQLMRATPPNGHRLFIIATTSERSVLERLGMLNAFDRQIAVPAVKDMRELVTALQQFGEVKQEVMGRAVQTLRECSDSDYIGVGIKTILTMTMALNADGVVDDLDLAEESMMNDPGSWLGEQLAEVIAANRPGMALENQI